MPNFEMREFEEHAQTLVSQALSLCELKIANGAESPDPRGTALCATALSLKEAINTFVALLKAG